MIRYFAYGSNLSRARLEERVGKVELVGVAWLPDHRHHFNKRGNDGTAKGNVEPAPGEKVWGAVYGIAADQKQTLDLIEGGYREERFEVILIRTGALIDTISYRGVALDEELTPTREYLGHYVAGAREHGLSEEYLRAILPAWYEL